MTNTNSVLAQFNFHGEEIRVLTIDGEPWWVANDVCAVLEISNPRDALRKLLEDDEKGVATIYTPGGDQQVSIINEPGLYSLVLRSRKPQARAFKRWVTHEVIPAIRRTGRYKVDDNRVPDVPPEMMDLFRLVAHAAAAAFAEEARAACRESDTVVVDAITATERRLASAVEGNARALAGLDARIERLIGAMEGGGATARVAPYVPSARPAPAGEPIWHLAVPEEALTFDALAELLSIELDRPDLSRNQIFEIARDAGLLRQLAPPYGGNTITDARLANLFRVRRISGAAHGWPCTHHFQPLVLPQGVAIMRQLVIQDIERGVL